MIPDLDQLKRALDSASSRALARTLPPVDLSSTIKKLSRIIGQGSGDFCPPDRIKEASQMFWKDPVVKDINQARYVAFGLSGKHFPNGTSMFDQTEHLSHFLSDDRGIGQWKKEAKWFRRPVQGLVASYFAYDPTIATETSLDNWRFLRNYIKSNLRNLTSKTDPDWVLECEKHPELFTDKPGQVFAKDLLEGKQEEFEVTAESLMIGENSWFLRDLIFSQIDYASRLSDREFSDLLIRLIDLVSNHRQIQDNALALILNRYATSSICPHNVPLKDTVVSLWGNPWLRSSDKRWPAIVTDKSKSLITQWLKSEFIEAFFTKMAEDGTSDQRRLKFWMGYLDSINTVQFALGTRALNDRDPDMRVLRKKMDGLITPIANSNAITNAFVMTMGNVIAVEFSDAGALYLYDANSGMPFDLSEPVTLTVNGPNSLKNREYGEWYRHQDNVHGYANWEDRLAETLSRPPFNISRSTSKASRGHSTFSESTFKPYPQESTVPASNDQRRTPEPSNIHEPPLEQKNSSLEWSDYIGSKFDLTKLYKLAQWHGLTIDDFRERNGNLWIRADKSNTDLNRVMLSWGFKYKEKKGWWK